MYLPFSWVSDSADIVLFRDIEQNIRYDSFNEDLLFIFFVHVSVVSPARIATPSIVLHALRDIEILLGVA